MKIIKTSHYQIYSIKKSKNLYIKLFNPCTNTWLPGKSSGTNKVAEAEKIAMSWLLEEPESKSSILKATFMKLISNEEIKTSDAQFICNYLKEKGLIANFVIPQTMTDIKASEYFQNFFDPEKSDFLKEKERMGKTICQSTLQNNTGIVKKYWLPFLKDRFLCELTKNDLIAFIEHLQNSKEIMNITKKTIVCTGFKVLRWAYKTEILEKDITAGIKNFSAKSRERKILTPETIKKLFASEWNNPFAKAANLLAYCTGMRAGEIVALRDVDIGENCIYLQHSWSNYDGLKSTKSGKSRIVYIYEKNLLELLRKLCKSNPKKKMKIMCSIRLQTQKFQCEPKLFFAP